MPNKLSDRKGFTLAELLVVVAIIAVLVSVSIPVFTTQFEKARESADIANLRSAYAEATIQVLINNVPIKDGTTWVYATDGQFHESSTQGVSAKATVDGWQGTDPGLGTWTSYKGKGEGVIKGTYHTGTGDTVGYVTVDFVK